MMMEPNYLNALADMNPKAAVLVCEQVNA